MVATKASRRAKSISRLNVIFQVFDRDLLLDFSARVDVCRHTKRDQPTGSGAATANPATPFRATATKRARWPRNRRPPKAPRQAGRRACDACLPIARERAKGELIMRGRYGLLGLSMEEWRLWRSR